MANQLVDNITHTYAGREFVESFFFQPQLEGKDLYSEFQFIPDLKGKMNIYLPRRLQKILRTDTGCATVTGTDSANLNDKTITGCKIRFDLEQCEDEFDATIFEEFRRSGTDRNDLTGTVIDDIMRTQTSKAVREDNQKLIWFGRDADADNFYGICDGFFNFLIDASSSLGYSLDMSTNSDVEVGGVLATDGAYELFKLIWANQPATLRNVPRADKKLYVTATLFDNYLETLESTGTGTDSGVTLLQDGRQQLKFRGVPVEEMPEWDDALADTDNPFSSEIGDNACIYTTPQNLVIGADVNDPEAQVQVQFDEYDELVKRKGKWIQGVQFVEEELIALAI